MLDQPSQFRPLPDRSFIGTWKWEPDQHIFYADEGLSSFFDVSPADAVKGLPASEFLHRLHPKDRASVIPTFSQAAQNGLPFAGSYRVITKHGGIRQVRSFGRPFGKKDGSWQYVGAIIDMGLSSDSRSAMRAAVDHLVVAGELLRAEPQSILSRLVEAVLLEAGHGAAQELIREGAAVRARNFPKP